MRLAPLAIGVTLGVVVLPGAAAGQTINATRLAILQAEDRRATSATDLATLRTGARSFDPQTVRLAVRALGRLERPALVSAILPALTHRDPAVRSEAANAVAQAASGARAASAAASAPTSTAARTRSRAQGGDAGDLNLGTLLQSFAARLRVEDDATVRGALAESLGRLPYDDPVLIENAQRVLVEHGTVGIAQRESQARASASGAPGAEDTTGDPSAPRQNLIADRLGVAEGLEALVRVQPNVVLLTEARDLLRGWLRTDPSKDARVRRLALEALTTVGAVDDLDFAKALDDPDTQVRRLAVRAAGRTHVQNWVRRGLEDQSPIVRLEAVRGLSGAEGAEREARCGDILAATTDLDPHVVLQAIDQLATCGASALAVARLVDAASERRALDEPRGWHRASHAMVALAAAEPDRARELLAEHASARNPFVRVYAARAAEKLGDRETLSRLTYDPNDNVVEAAVDGLSAVAAVDGADRYVAALDRRGYQAIRAAARALETAPIDQTVNAALSATLNRLVAEGHANSTDARRALAAALEHRGMSLPARALENPPLRTRIELDDLRRLAAPRARFTIRDVGVIDVALITTEAPATVLQVARLAEGGYYNGLTIHRVVPNFVLQGGSPDANEYVGHPDYMRDELGQWPHVRGALGISTRGRDTGDAQFFIDLLDNPRLDHQYTVFGQVIAGIDVADRILEGDVIESVQILDERKAPR